MSKTLNFEDNLKNLEEIVKKLEDKEITLDEAITKYKEGLKLSKDLLEELKKAEEVVVEEKE